MRLIIIAIMVCVLNVSADVGKGQKAYLKKMKSKTHMNGTKFASLHTVEEWRELFQDEGESFREEMVEEFPKLKRFMEKKGNWKYLKHIRDFVVNYGSDSGNFPTCG